MESPAQSAARVSSPVNKEPALKRQPANRPSPFIRAEDLSLPGLSKGIKSEKIAALPVEAQHQLGLLMARSSLYAFFAAVFDVLAPGRALKPNWHLELICDHLESVAKGETRRLIINLPPRSLKSSLVSRAFTAWWWLHNPTLKSILVTYGQELTREIKQDFDRLIGSDVYRQIACIAASLPASLSSAPLVSPASLGSLTFHPGFHLAPTAAQLSEQRLTRTKNVSGGSYHATTVGGGLTGLGGDLLLIDDPIKASGRVSDAERTSANEWITQTAFSRFDNPADSVILVIMQRLHEDDLSGRLLETGQFEHLCLPAEFEGPRTFEIKPRFGRPKRAINLAVGDLLHSAQLSKAYLEGMEVSLGRGTYRAQYLQDPCEATRLSFDVGCLATYDLPGPSLTSHEDGGENIGASVSTSNGRAGQARNLDLTPFVGTVSGPAYMPRGEDRLGFSANELPFALRHGRLCQVACLSEYRVVSSSARTLLIQSWDTATSLADSADYSVCTTWFVAHPRTAIPSLGMPQYSLLHVHRARHAFEDLHAKVKELARAFHPHLILIEDANAGTSLLQSLDGHEMPPLLYRGKKGQQYAELKAIRPRESKDQRLESCLPALRFGSVRVPSSAPWKEEFLRELSGFGTRKHDDQIDSLTQALNFDLSDHWSHEFFYHISAMG